jgi:ABC-type molybdenum transport system ATPase subunit/photorepair protein PhrA
VIPAILSEHNLKRIRGGSAMMVVEGLTKRYNEKEVVSNLPIQVQKGEIY